MNRYTYGLLASLCIAPSLASAQDIFLGDFENSLGNVRVFNQSGFVPQPRAQAFSPSKSADVLKLLFEGKTQEGAQVAIEHLISLMPAYLDSDPKKQMPYLQEVNFIQFIQAYDLGNTILDLLPATTGDLERATLAEMVGNEEDALTLYEKTSDPKLRKRYAFLLAKHGQLEKAKEVLASVPPKDLASIIQSFQGMISSQVMFNVRLDYLDLLITALEHVDPNAYLPAEWLPNLIDNYIAQGHYSSDERDVRMVELYADGDYRTSYNSPEQEERSEAATERRLALHEALCHALMRLPQFADEGFRRFSGLASKHDAEGSIPDLAINILKMPAAPSPPEGHTASANTTPFHSHWVPFYSPLEYLLRQAMEADEVDAFIRSLTPILRAANKGPDVTFLGEIQATLASSPEEMPQKAADLMLLNQASMSPNHLIRLLFGVMKSREVVNKGPLIEAYLTRIAQSPYPQLEDIVSYAEEQRKVGLQHYEAFLRKVGTIMLGPPDQQAALIAEHYNPNLYNPESPGMRINNYVSFLAHMGQNLNLVAPVLSLVEDLSLNHPNDYQIRNAIQNSLQSYRYRNQSAALYQFLQDSPFLNDLAEFRPYPMSNVERESVFGHLLESLRSLSSNDQARVMQPIRNHKPDTFGKQLILSFVDAGSNSSRRSLALAEVLENSSKAISELPAERQRELFEWFRNMHSNRSSLSSTIRNACPKTAAWYQAMQEKAGANPSQQPLRGGGGFRNNSADGLPSIDKFLAAESRIAIEVQYPLQHMATQLAQSVFSSDLKQAEAVIVKYLELATQAPSANFGGGNTPPVAELDSVLAQLLGGSPGTENLGFVIKMIHLANDPNQGLYPALENSMHQALANEGFEPVSKEDNDMANTFLSASGGHVHELLLPMFLRRFQSLDQDTLERIMAWAENHQAHPLAAILQDAASLALAFMEPSKVTDSVIAAFVTRLQDTQQPLGLRVQACPVIFPMALQARTWPIADACLTLLGDAFDNANFAIPTTITGQMIASSSTNPAEPEEKRLIKRLLELWGRHSDRLPMSVFDLQRATTLAARADYPAKALLATLPEALFRQPGVLTSLVRMDAEEAALNAVPWSLITMPPMPQTNNRRSRSSRGRSGTESVVMVLGQGRYDAPLHAKAAPFLTKIEDPGQRLFVDFLMSAQPDADDLPENIPNRDARLRSLIERFDRNLFNSPYLAEHTLGWLCAASGEAPEPLRADVAHFGRQINYQTLSQWNDNSLRASRMTVWNHFLMDAADNAPELFATILTEMLEEIGSDRGQSQQLLETYVGDFPRALLKDVTSITQEKAASYLPLLKTLSELSRRTYWSGRDSCINGNIVMHVLADQADAYADWKSTLNEDTLSYLEQSMNLDEIVYMMRKTLSPDETPKERRSQILNGLFATTAPSATNNNRSRNPQDTNVFQRMIDLNVLTTSDILENGTEWAEDNPRGGAAFGELAAYQAEAGQVDEAIVNYTQAVIHAPAENQLLYSRYLLANAELLLKQDRLDAAMTWFDFAQSGRIHPNFQSEHEHLRRQVQIRYLTDPDRMTTTFAQSSQRLNSNPRDLEAWLDLTNTLSAYGGERMAQSDYLRGLSVLKLAYYLLHKVHPLDPNAVDALLPTVSADLSKGLIALGMGGRKKFLVPRQQRWHYHYAEGGIDGDFWKMHPMSQADWDEAMTPIGYGNGNEATVIEFGDDEDNKPITAYFNKEVTFTNLTESDQLSMNVLHDDGVIVYIDGKEVARNNMPSGRVDAQTQAPSSRGGSDELTYWTVQIPSNAINRSRATHIIAAEVHQNDPDSSDLSFDLELYTEALNQAEIIEDIETGNPLKPLAQWKDQLPANLIDIAKSLSNR